MSLVEVLSETVYCLDVWDWGQKWTWLSIFSYIVGLYVLFFVSSPQCVTQSYYLSKQLYILQK
jgi:hypothetical protein